MNKFGQRVWITIEGEGGEVILDASDLRIDFDIRLIDGFRRGSFSVYGLAPETVGNISNGTRFVTLKTQLHDGPIYTLANKWYVSNALEVISVPNTVTTIYCFDTMRKNYLEKQIENVVVENPTLRRMVEAINRAVGFKGKPEYKHFPDGYIDTPTKRPIVDLGYSAQQCFRNLQRQYQFNLYTEDNHMILMHKPDFKDFKQTSFFTDPADVQLRSENMRANPILGPASLVIKSNLDPDIRPSAILDTKNLVTYEVNPSQATLQIADDFIKLAVSGFSKYLTIAVQHTGSNYTANWFTKASSYTVTKGRHMPSNAISGTGS